MVLNTLWRENAGLITGLYVSPSDFPATLMGRLYWETSMNSSEDRKGRIFFDDRDEALFMATKP